jgi:hypothetical protein
MPTPLIQYPAVTIAAGQKTTIRLSPLTLPTGRVIGDFASFALAVREDPEWPRSGATEAARHRADPIADGWEVVVTAAGELDEDDVITFTFTMDAGAGADRYSYDAWGTLSAGGEIQLVRATWVTCGARVVAAS